MCISYIHNIFDVRFFFKVASKSLFIFSNHVLYNILYLLLLLLKYYCLLYYVLSGACCSDHLVLGSPIIILTPVFSFDDVFIEILIKLLIVTIGIFSNTQILYTV